MPVNKKSIASTSKSAKTASSTKSPAKGSKNTSLRAVEGLKQLNMRGRK
jgi:hypothetical protein